jgi:hypothetical protein
MSNTVLIDFINNLTFWQMALMILGTAFLLSLIYILIKEMNEKWKQ